MKRVTITIPDNLYQRVVEYKKEKGYATISELIRDAIKKLME